MSAVARVQAQAKVNLFLRILAREANGYHQLDTLFCRLELADDVRVRVGVRGRSLDCSGARLPAGGLGPVERNLAWRAALAYAERTGWPTGFAIEIDKRIPVGGGLGGGSADAGAVLRALNVLSPTPLPAEALLDLGASLGADVPFLTSDAALALAWGRGERLLALPPLPRREAWLYCFDFGVSTVDAYRWIDEAGIGGGSASALSLADLATWRGVAALAWNDFETVVSPRHPAIADVLAAGRGAPGSGVLGEDGLVLLSGSGSTVALILGSDCAGSVVAPPGVVVTHTAERVVEVEVDE